MHEFWKYLNDWTKQEREKYPTLKLDYWGNYPDQKYGIYASYTIPNDGPEIPGYVKIPLGFCVHGENGYELEITTDLFDLPVREMIDFLDPWPSQEYLKYAKDCIEDPESTDTPHVELEITTDETGEYL